VRLRYNARYREQPFDFGGFMSETKKTDKPAEQPAAAPALKVVEKMQDVYRATNKHYGLAEHKTTHHYVDVPEGRTLEETLHNGFLYHLREHFRRGHLVTVHDELWRWEYQLRILKVDAHSQSVFTSMLYFKEHTTGSASVDWDRVTIEKKGSFGKWTVLLGPHALIDKFETREDAEQWVDKKKREAAALAVA
jgi:hypothetical protein